MTRTLIALLIVTILLWCGGNYICSLPDNENMNNCWLDLIQASTQIITTFIASLMAYFAWKTYLKEPLQEAEPSEAKERRDLTEELTELIVFNTKKQKTTLKANDEGLSCYLKNKKDNTEQLQWSMSKDEARHYYSRNNFHVYPGYKANVGTFSIGPRRNWLYSKSLFPEAVYLEDEIKLILQSAAGIPLPHA